MEDEVDDLESRLDKMESLIHELKTDVACLTEEVDEKEGTVSDMEDKIARKRSRIDNLCTIIVDLKGDVRCEECDHIFEIGGDIYDCGFCAKPMNISGADKICRKCKKHIVVCPTCIDKMRSMQCYNCKLEQTNERMRQRIKVLKRDRQLRRAKAAAVCVGACFNRIGGSFRDLSPFLVQLTWASRNDECWCKK
jgi:hypothetical protein